VCCCGVDPLLSPEIFPKQLPRLLRSLFGRIEIMLHDWTTLHKSGQSAQRKTRWTCRIERLICILSLTPGFSQVHFTQEISSRFNGFGRFQKAVETAEHDQHRLHLAEARC
jgi:hypothetical protein